MISKRIKRIASFISPQRNIADVGCDHGYLIKWSFDNDIIDYALAIDNKKNPLESAKKNLINYSNIDFSLSNGISCLNNLIDCIIIAGIGGINIINILKDEMISKDYKYILQPNRNAYELRLFLSENSFEIINEDVVFEDNLFYEIIVVKKVNMPIHYNELQVKYGPILLKNKTETFIKMLDDKLKRIIKIENPSSKILKMIEEIKEIIC